ncbi:MAG: hypothetical protein NWF03_05145, partial [Candidatus Bathyarchaeota archaeon]|nr:hypothetical protein [Candidatus Bathyarchaeota archaeon]
IKANYEGDADTLGTSSEIVNFAVTNLIEKNTMFSVSSNSTVTSLAFNSTTSDLTFMVTGPSGTKGYVKCTIAKSIVSNAENIKVSLDGNQLNYDIRSTEDSWLLSFTYSHSSHNVNINLPTNSENILPSQEYWTLIFAVITIALIGISLIGYFKKIKRKTKN